MNGNTLFYKKPAKYWTEAIPMGNGSMGAMFFSGTRKDRIAMNNDTLWSGHPQTPVRDGAYESYKKAQSLIRENKNLEAEKELKNNFFCSDSQAYLPLCNIFLKFGMGFAIDYERRLDLASSILTICSQIGMHRVQKNGVSFSSARCYGLQN